MSKRTYNELMRIIGNGMNELEQHDYTGRKVAFEVAAVLREKFPEADLPSYDEYKQNEDRANEVRKEIAEARAALESGDYEQEE